MNFVTCIKISTISLIFTVTFFSCEKKQEIPVIDSAYDSKILSGFLVKISQEYPYDNMTWIGYLDTLERYLDTIMNYIPYETLENIQNIPLYISYPEKEFDFKFWQAGSSSEVDDTRKIGSIEVGNLQSLINRQRTLEPGTLIYAFSLLYFEELSDAHQNLIMGAYQNATKDLKYSDVDQYTCEGIITGAESPASKSPEEYFAKISQAYFNISDYFPFIYEDLKSYDPEGFNLLKRIWGPRLIKDYLDINGHGFKIKYRKDEADNTEVVNAISKVFNNLETMSDSLNDNIMEILREQPIWIELNNGTGACFHPNKIWILQNSHVPEKAHCVEITNATNFNEWTSVNQPLIVWHELSHYLHYHVAGWENTVIKSAYEHAKSNGLYTDVELINADGTITIAKEAYALTNDKEYFAECSEAYWGTNDFFPFTRVELMEYDSVGYKMVEQIWNN